MTFDDYDSTVQALEHGFSHPRILVLGDLMLDRHLFGEVKRISPEAPVPVLKLERQSQVVGGAGNVARNLAKLGARVSMAAVVGRDADGDVVRSCLAAEAMDADLILSVEDRPTTVKTRLIGGHQQMLRIDSELAAPLAPSDQAFLTRSVIEKLSGGGIAAVVLSDYDKGVLTRATCRTVIETARQLGIPVFADPKGSDMEKYRGATTLTPNRSEFAILAAQAGASDLPLAQAGLKVLEWLELGFLVVTRSEEGMSLIRRDGAMDVPATAREVFDVTGAGDTVISALCIALCAGLGLPDAVRLSNVAGGVVVARIGTAPAETSDLLLALEQERTSRPGKALPLEHATKQVARWIQAGERVVFTNGCFDILHAGHVDYLEASRRCGDRLVVGLNSDASVRRLKGPNRPVHSQDDRARVLSALGAVDAVVVFDEETPLNLILALRPDVLTKGADYTEDKVVGAKEVRSWGGDVRLLDLLEGRSTSAALEKLSR